MITRLQVSELAKIPVQAWSSEPGRLSTFWTDGSVANSHFWPAIGSCAVCNDQGQVIYADRVSHWSLSAYTSELCAVLQAFARATFKTHLVSDSKSVVSQCLFLIQDEYVPSHWSHFTWWSFLLDLTLSRKSFRNQPLTVEWTPAHLIDHTNNLGEIHYIAQVHNVSAINLRRNKQADAAAAAVLNTPDNQQLNNKFQAIAAWQVRLVDTALLLAEFSNKEDFCEPVPVNRPALTLSPEFPVNDFQRVFPLWDWNPQRATFSWKTRFVIASQKQPPASLSADNWGIIKHFLSSLSWKLDQHAKTSFLELAFALNIMGYKLVDKPDFPAAVSTLIREAISFARQIQRPHHPLVPGRVLSTCKANGKAHTSGHSTGALAHIPVRALCKLACAFGGRSHALKEWSVLFSDLGDFGLAVCMSLHAIFFFKFPLMARKVP